MYQSIPQVTFEYYYFSRFVKYNKHHGSKYIRHYNNTVLLLNTTEIIDSSSKSTPITNISGVTLDTDNTKYSEGSLILNLKQILVPNTTDLDMGTTVDFTLETWWYPYALPLNGTVFEFGFWTSSLLIRPNGSTSLHIYCNGSNYSVNYTFTTNTWYHLVAQRRNGQYEVYVNGMLVRSFTNSFNIIGKDLAIGYSAHSTSQRMNGLLSFICLTKGIAVYQGEFNPNDSTRYSTAYLYGLQLNESNTKARPYFNY